MKKKILSLSFGATLVMLLGLSVSGAAPYNLQERPVTGDSPGGADRGSNIGSVVNDPSLTTGPNSQRTPASVPPSRMSDEERAAELRGHSSDELPAPVETPRPKFRVVPVPEARPYE